MEIAIVHDYFTQLGGAERVAASLYELFPNASVFATVVDKDRLPAELRSAEIGTTWMQGLPSIQRMYRHYAPLYPLAVASLDLRGYEVVISSSSGFAKGVQVDPAAVHVCYCHTPMRWVWRFDDYAEREQFSWHQRVLLRGLVGYLRRWDLKASRQPDQFIANSQTVATRIWETYHRHALVIPPPIDVDRFSIASQQDDFYLVLSRLVGYKRVDLAIEACARIGRKLVVIGDGPDRERLQAMADENTTFLGRVPDGVVADYVGRCRALLFPGEEDFGMVPLEVNAAGRPVVAFHGGGAVETVLENVTGTFFHEPTSAALAAAILQQENMSWSPQLIRRHAEGYSKQVFHTRMLELLASIAPYPAAVEVPRGAAA